MDTTGDQHKLSWAGLLVTVGIIYGDIGTSPLYTMKFLVGDRPITDALVLGGLSCVFWTLTLVTSIKYIWLALNADNRGEGGIFALYALVRKFNARWVIYAAIIGCCTLIADGFITPAISVTSAVEGFQLIYPEAPTVLIVFTILFFLFIFQQFGSVVVGKTFGPVMTVWFIMLAVLGSFQLAQNPAVLKALNPYYAWSLVANYPQGFVLLSAVFLCTTGAEALYSDLGHCGKQNIRVSWVFVKICLLINYFGQGAWLLTERGNLLQDQIPFFAIMPNWFLVPGIIIATFAAIIASQAFITGTFSLINEAMKLKLWPAARVVFPSNTMGQLYVPKMNWTLMVGSITAVLIFRESSAMEGAYGLAITVNMLMTTALLVFYFAKAKQSRFRSVLLCLGLFTLEGMFLASNLHKFEHGGWFTVLIALMFFVPMFIFLKARILRQRHTEFVDVRHYQSMLKDLQEDDTVPKEATNLVYLAVADSKNYIDCNIVYSIFRKRPKRADVYWFVHVETVDSPFASQYKVDTIIPKRAFFVNIKLGFKQPHRVSTLFNKVIHDMADNGEIDLTSPYPALQKYSMMSDFKFISLHTWASSDSVISGFERFVILTYRMIKSFSLPTEEMYGLEAANIEIEKVPIQVGPLAKVWIKRERQPVDD
jgi:KUP system potassium uptake protein